MLLRLTDIEPIPCPRPRLSRFGAYYPANYTMWKRKADKVLRQAVKGLPEHRVIDYPIDVWISFLVRKPRATRLYSPKPDIDNYMKAIFDACNGIIWKDDSLVQTVWASKLWAELDKPGIYLWVNRHEGRSDIHPSRTMPEVRVREQPG